MKNPRKEKQKRMAMRLVLRLPGTDKQMRVIKGGCFHSFWEESTRDWGVSWRITPEPWYERSHITEFFRPQRDVITLSHCGLRHKVKSRSPLKVKISYLRVWDMSTGLSYSYLSGEHKRPQIPIKLRLRRKATNASYIYLFLPDLNIGCFDNSDLLPLNPLTTVDIGFLKKAFLPHRRRDVQPCQRC